MKRIDHSHCYRVWCSLFTLLLCLTVAEAQDDCGWVYSGVSEAFNASTPNCVHNGFTDSSFNTDYIPEPTDDILTIRIALHIIHDGTGGGNFQEGNAEHLAFLNSIFDNPGALGGPNVNDVFASIEPEMVDGIAEPPEVQDSRIRFQLEELRFRNDAVGWSNDTSLCGCYLYDNYALDPCKYLNVFFFGRPTPQNTEVVGCGPTIESGYGCTVING